MPTVALFPLRAVLVPGLVLPLHIFEPRYRLMIRTLSEAPEDERGFGIVAIRPGVDPEAHGPAALYEMGTMARITQVDVLPDGRFDITTVGARRFSIESVDQRLPYLRARVRMHPEPVGDARRARELGRVAVGLLQRYRDLIASWRVIDMAAIEQLPGDPVVLSYLVSAAIVTGLEQRQSLLGIPDAEQRLARACAVLRHELAMMSALPSMPAVDLASTPVWNN